MTKLQIAIALIALYLILTRNKKEGFISMHDSRDNPMYRD